jgi:outer membrane protein OmpA-like peptidoglycan-associated protein
LSARLAEAREVVASYAEKLVIHFANNSSRLADTHQVQAAADAVRGAEAIVVAGFTDATYVNAAGEDLARRRAENVQAALIAHGVSASHLTIAYHAAGSFVAENQSDEGKALNRRVEIVPDTSMLQARR